jgi:hypothetical protein
MALGSSPGSFLEAALWLNSAKFKQFGWDATNLIHHKRLIENCKETALG